MDDLTRFALGWAVLLAVVAFVMFRRDIARWVAAVLLAGALKQIVRDDEAPRSVWHVDRDGRVRTDARPIVMSVTKR